MGVTVTTTPALTFDAEMLADIVSAATIGEVVTRTEDGYGADDEKMAPYSEGYRRKLQREGRDTKVDLHYSGLMLSQVREVARTVVSTDGHGVPMVVRLTFGVGGAGNRNSIAAYNHARRPWFDLSPKGEQRVRDAIAEGARVSAHTTARTKGPVRQRDSRGRFLKGVSEP